MNEFSRKDIFERTISLIGEDSFYKLNKSKIALFGLGGVGSFIFDSLVRSGIEDILIVDFDKVEISNINRQLFANTLTIGKYKVDIAKEHGLNINPYAKIEAKNIILGPDNINELGLERYDYIVDAIDDINGKMALIKFAHDNKIDIISAMGGGYKIDPSQFKVSDIYNTRNCPLARKMRKMLRDESIEKLKVVYSEESIKGSKGGPIPTIAFVPSSMGLLISSEVVKDIINK